MSGLISLLYMSLYPQMQYRGRLTVIITFPALDTKGGSSTRLGTLNEATPQDCVRMSYSDFIVYVDESGDHSLVSIDAAYPIFSLAFCIFRKSQYARDVLPAITELKFDHFGHDQVVLHEREIRKAEGEFSFLVDRSRREQFLADLNDLVADACFEVIAGVIHKRRLVDQYARPDSPYDLALLFCMERLWHSLRTSSGCTTIVFERRGRREDKNLEKVFHRICNGDNHLGVNLPFKIRFADKRANSGGLQIADLVARPIGIKVLREDQSNRAWDILEPKIRRNPQGHIQGWGLKVFPS